MNALALLIRDITNMIKTSTLKPDASEFVPFAASTVCSMKPPAAPDNSLNDRDKADDEAESPSDGASQVYYGRIERVKAKGMIVVLRRIQQTSKM